MSGFGGEYGGISKGNELGPTSVELIRSFDIDSAYLIWFSLPGGHHDLNGSTVRNTFELPEACHVHFSEPTASTVEDTHYNDDCIVSRMAKFSV